MGIRGAVTPSEPRVVFWDCERISRASISRSAKGEEFEQDARRMAAEAQATEKRTDCADGRDIMKYLLGCGLCIDLVML